MSQADNKDKIIVKLLKDNEVDVLDFNLGAGKRHKLNINLEDNQSEIKAMFCDLVELLEKNSLQLILEVEEGYDNKLLEEVSNEYLKDLNKELENIRAEILDKYLEEVDL